MKSAASRRDPVNNFCPHCEADLNGEPIPEKYAEHYGGATHYERTIGVEIRGVYDGVLFWQCPDCGGTWQRWGPYSRLHEKARRYIHE